MLFVVVVVATTSSLAANDVSQYKVVAYYQYYILGKPRVLNVTNHE